MKQIVFVFALICLLSGSFVTAQLPAWYLCPGSATHISVGTFNVSISPPHPPCNISIVLSGKVDEQVTSGSLGVGVSYSGIPLSNQTLPYTSSNIALPFGPGALTFQKTVEIPAVAPQGSYGIDLTWFDQNNNPLVCVHQDFTL